MRWSKSIRGDADGPVIQRFPVYDASSIIQGESMKYGATTQLALLISGGQLGADFVGVAQETVAASTTALTTGTIVFCNVVVDPYAVFRVEQDLTASADVDVVSSTSTAITLGASDDDLDGSWIYINTGTGAGQLVFIGEASTTVFTLDTTAAFTTTPDSTSDVVILRRPGPGGRDLEATGVKMLSDEDETGKFLVMENFIGSSKVPECPLHPKNHHGKIYASTDLILSSDLYPTDHALRGAATI